MPYFSTLAGQEVPEIFEVMVGGFQVTTMPYLNKVAFELL